MRSWKCLAASSFLVIALASFGLSAGCLNESGLNPPWLDAGAGTGGRSTGGDRATGGQSSGGAGTGGLSTGGIGTGGLSTGGLSTGGTAAAGGSTGGFIATGGTATAGAPATGGVASGGKSVGGSGGQGGQGGATVCAPSCTLACPNGFVLDARGCPTCMCKPVMCPAIKCANNCSFGFEKDTNGCETCNCVAPPPCTSTECGSAPDAPVFACADGTKTATHCARDTSGKCVWSFDGCSGACSTQLTCTSSCLNGYQRNASGCTNCTCLGAAACDSCGPTPLPSTFTCDDGTVDGYVCQQRTTSSGPGPGGGCTYTHHTCPTVPTSGCSRYLTSGMCSMHADCAWLVSGCSAPALGATGCYSTKDLGCQGDNDCGLGKTCVQRNVNPCQGIDAAHCASCAATISLCLP